VKVYKVINNNIVRSYDEKGNEIIVMGKGLGFKKQVGDLIAEESVEKVYRFQDANNSQKLVELLERIPEDHVRIANLIIDYAKQSLHREFADSLYLSITDHISFALERNQKGIPLKNALLWEIKKYYPSEFLCGKESLEIIKRESGISLQEDEAGYIAMHLVEASMSSEQPASSMLQTIDDVLRIVRYHFQVELDEHSLAYERFMIHLKFFLERVATAQETGEETALYSILEAEYPAEFACCDKIRNYFQKEKGFEVTKNELVYLAIHIHRIIESKGGKSDEL